jgi:hypothetical protein
LEIIGENAVALMVHIKDLPCLSALGEEAGKSMDSIIEAARTGKTVDLSMVTALQDEVTRLRIRNTELEEQLTAKEAELNELKEAIERQSREPLPEVIEARLSDTTVPEWRSAIPPELRAQLGLSEEQV